MQGLREAMERMLDERLGQLSSQRPLQQQQRQQASAIGEGLEQEQSSAMQYEETEV